MTILGDYLKYEYNEDFYIEVEGRPNTLKKFIDEYKKEKSITGNIPSGIVELKESANKYGLEYRLYLKNIDNIPPEIGPITNNSVYRKEYQYRINIRSIIKPLLFEDGFVLGQNF